MREITHKDVESVCRRNVWDFGNKVLYDLCQSHPKHKRDDEIVAKIWLIGRSYAAAIERRKTRKDDNDQFYESVVGPAIRQSRIDVWLSSIRRNDDNVIRKSVQVHKKVMDLFCSFTGLKKRSLASKYLHFHKPDSFFIYDSRAKRSIMKVTPRINPIPEIVIDVYDREYRDFVRRCLWLRSRIKEKFNQRLTPREIDKMLLMIAED